MVLPAQRSLITEPLPLPREEPVLRRAQLQRSARLRQRGWPWEAVCYVTLMLWGRMHETSLCTLPDTSSDLWELQDVVRVFAEQLRRSPRNPEQKIIKRVIALEGDIIKTIGYKKKYVKVPHGHIWVEGDHHGHSFDSNAFGPVSLGLLHARATHILWPPKRWQKLQPMLPPERKPLQREQ
ncbi:mitochondrial inner membrane protease subunit 2 isoform X1 [Lagopus muta]|uniref:mitochondrial inner membrane protease subunit 2 isoform X1 n=1 Tax=Lagopus muta TaxID=64668 RepID=UPI00209E36C1|nr:mitochondrial inner membrane protease subunit 2 isoform X1 [Lagopus muta]